MTLAIGVDVGGTKVLGALVDDGGEVLAQEKRSTPPQDGPGAASAVVETVVAVVTALAAGRDVDGVGVAVAGRVDPDRHHVRSAANLGWDHQPLAAAVESATGLRTVVENDANAAAWAEHRYGAGVGVDDLVVVTVGTGIGGALVLGGRLHRGASGSGGEIGHAVHVVDGLPCGCGRTGCFEQYASGRALVREARALAAERPDDAALLLSLAGSVDAVSGHHVTAAAVDGDPVARLAFQRIGDHLGRGLADLAEVLDPRAFVVGGGVSDAGDLLLQPARAALARELPDWSPDDVPAVLRAALGTGAGAVGAADLARRR
ncbi:MAG: ROK family glucokinase [Candidatus Nanopelagicales bacterium]